MLTFTACGGNAGRSGTAASGSTGSTDTGSTGSTGTGGHGVGGAGTGGAGAGAACGDVASFIPAWAAKAVPSKEIYVSPSGDDNLNDGSKAKPFQTTAKAFSLLAPGVRLDFGAGTYACPPFVSGLAATTAAPAMVRSSDGPRAARFDCGGTADFFFSHVSGVVLDGLEIANTAGHGVQLDSGNPFDPTSLSADFVLMRSYVHDTALAGIKVAQSRRVYVIGNEFAHSGPGRQDVEFVATDAVAIVGNDAHDSDAFNEVKGGAHGGVIAHNHIHDMNPGGGGILVGGDCTGKQFLVDPTVDFEATGLEVWGNVITGADGFAFRVVGCHECLIANNTYWSPAPKAILRILHDSFASVGGSGCDVPLHNKNLVVENNVFAWPNASTYVIASDEDPANVKLAHNLWFVSGGDIAKYGSDLPFLGEPTSVYNVDPRLVSPPGDVSLAAGSPAKGAGVSLPGVPGRFDGTCWPGAPDLGAY